MQEGGHTLDCRYPPSFLSSSGDQFFVCLPLLSRNVLLSCVQRFRSIPKGRRTKTDHINFIRNDTVQQANQLIMIQSPTLDLLRHFPSLPDHPMPRLSSVCRSAHGRYGSTIVSQLLCWQTRWNPPKVEEHEIPQPTWFKTPPSQLKRRLSKINPETIKSCCDVYLLPEPTSK